MRSTKAARLNPATLFQRLAKAPVLRPRTLVGRHTVLMVDEAAGAPSGFTRELQAAGFKVEQASTTQPWMLERRRPDAVIIRVSTEPRDLSLLQALQGDEPVPVIALVDDLRALAKVQALELPLFDFLLLPHTAAECVQRVERALALRNRLQELSSRAMQLEQQVSVDFKTGLTSELYLRRILQLEWKRAERHHNPLSLLLLDVDDFKGVNDSTEYKFGDLVLQKVGETLLQCVRETDFAARLGGDEFCVLLPQTASDEALLIARRIAERTAAMTVQGGGFSRGVTVSIGIDTYHGSGPMSLEQLRLRANQALHQSKRQGKNQVRCAPAAASQWHAQAH